MGKARKIGHHQRAAFALICDDTRKGFSEVIDLILIHNERVVRGTQPRTTLNPFMALLSVAAWERLVADIGLLARSIDPSAVAPGTVGSQGFNTLGADANGGPSMAISTLTVASGQQLPDRWRIRITSRSQGKFLKFGYTAEGLDPLMTELVDWWVLVRHKVAHRGLPQLLTWLEKTDAHDGQTINTRTARSAFTLFYSSPTRRSGQSPKWRSSTIRTNSGCPRSGWPAPLLLGRASQTPISSDFGTDALWRSDTGLHQDLTTDSR
ncbi:hypothetical protein OG203_10890 [Nocardia sp. NBC_01499]|uniref:hypothetical protein n=1 Tax=Nocardia sp. NBC_01499 TaxID=2903597 RepID=UPI0038655680